MGTEVGTEGITPGHRRLLWMAAGATYLLVTLGATVCVTGSTLGCPDWPGCYGRLVPPARADSIIEYSHRLIAILAAPLVLATVLLGWRRARDIPWVRRGPTVAVVLFGAVAAFGAFAVLTGLPPWLAAVDLGSALLALALLVATATLAGAAGRRGGYPGRLRLDDPFQRLAAGTVGTTFMVFVTGVLVARPGSVARCLGWPLYGGSAVAATHGGILPDLRIALSGAAAAGIVATWLYARRHHGGERHLVRKADGAVVLLGLEMVLGVWLTAHGPSAVALVAYVALASGLWAVLTALLAEAALPKVSATARDGYGEPAVPSV